LVTVAIIWHEVICQVLFPLLVYVLGHGGVVGAAGEGPGSGARGASHRGARGNHYEEGDTDRTGLR